MMKKEEPHYREKLHRARDQREDLEGAKEQVEAQVETVRRRKLVTQVYLVQSLILTQMEPNTLPTGRDNHEVVKVQEEDEVIRT